MSEIHIEHKTPENMKVSIRERRGFLHNLKALVVDMIPVVLGILVAISLSGLKEIWKEHKEANYFLQRIKADLEEDLRELELDVAQYKIKKKAAAYLLVTSLATQVDKDSAYYYFRFLPGQTAPNITNAAYITLLSGGKLGVIENNAIEESLVLLYTDIVPGLIHITTSFNEFKSKNVNDVVFTELDYIKLTKTKDLAPALAQRKIRNALAILWFDEVIQRYELAISAHRKLINDIEREL